MCKKSKSNAKVLKDRTAGLDARGNSAVNTQAESAWAVQTLNGLDANAVALLKTDLERVYDATVGGGAITAGLTSRFQKGYRKFLGDDDADPSAQDLVGLMLESEYNFKGAVDALDRDQKSVAKPLWMKNRGKKEFTDRGRVEGRQRRDSFINPHAGITDHVFRQEETENFFGREVVHAKGVLEGDPKSETYQRFVEQGAPFIGGVSGTMQGLTMAWELEQPLQAIEDDQEKATELARREKLAGIYMATLLAGGHHSASEMLFSAQTYGLFPDVADPLANYPLAMQQLGARFAQLQLPGELSPKAGATWRAAQQAVVDGLAKLRSEIADTYKTEDYVGDLTDGFDTEVVDKVGAFFTGDLADKLDEIVGLVADQDRPARQVAIQEAVVLIAAAREKLDEDIIDALDGNPFTPLAIRSTVGGALDQVSALAR